MIRAAGYMGVILGLLAAFVGLLPAQKFHRSDPMKVDNDRLIDVQSKPEELELSDLFDRFGHVFTDIGDPDFTESENVNSLDEVPDSSWFTNRHGRSRMTIEQLARGANFDGPPDPNVDWWVFRGKSQGVTPGFFVETEDGARFVIKFDPVAVPELASAAEVVASKIFYALGYNVPQNHIVYVDPERFKIREGTQVEDSFGDMVRLTDFGLRRMLSGVPRSPDDTVRVTASRFIEGSPLGPFRYYGTRTDDPNDVILHENRRELRGLRLFAAWTNHDDTRAQNTHNSWVEENGRHFIRHYLMDFGSTFGSGSVHIQLAYLGFNFSVPIQAMKYNAAGMGVRVPTFRKVTWPEFPKYQAVGRWESEWFDPEDWKGDYPNPAFVRMTARDAFWAAKILMKFTSEELLAIVKTGRYTEEHNTSYFHRVLVERQRKCGKWGIELLNPLDEFRVEGDELKFANLSEEYGFSAEGSTRYQVFWHLFDNENQRIVASSGPVVETQPSSSFAFREPFLVDDEMFILVEIHSLNEKHPNWTQGINVYLRPTEVGYEVVGIERESPARAFEMR